MCTNFSDNIKCEREITGLLEAMEAHSLKSGLVLTEDTEDMIKINRKTIYMKPVWKWAVEEIF